MKTAALVFLIVTLAATVTPQELNTMQSADTLGLRRLVFPGPKNSLGGSISGEHGIGTTKAKFLSWEIGEREIALMRAIKQLLDPNNILNPGKIFVS